MAFDFLRYVCTVGTDPHVDKELFYFSPSTANAKGQVDPKTVTLVILDHLKRHYSIYLDIDSSRLDLISRVGCWISLSCSLYMESTSSTMRSRSGSNSVEVSLVPSSDLGGPEVKLLHAGLENKSMANKQIVEDENNWALEDLKKTPTQDLTFEIGPMLDTGL